MGFLDLLRLRITRRDRLKILFLSWCKGCLRSNNQLNIKSTWIKDHLMELQKNNEKQSPLIYLININQSILGLVFQNQSNIMDNQKKIN